MEDVSSGNGSKGYNFKVVLLGEGCVGKTSLVMRYVEDKFSDKHITTLQVNHYSNIFIYITFTTIVHDVCHDDNSTVPL